MTAVRRTRAMELIWRRAREAQGEERHRLYARVKALDSGYAVYEARTKRRIAVVVLDPATAPA